MHPTEFTLFMLLILNADPETGVWHGSARSLAHWYIFSERTCRDNLEKLEKKGYIKRFQTPGKHSGYPILVSRYEVSMGAAVGKYLNIEKSTSCSNLVYDGAVEGAVEGADVNREIENKRKKQKLLREGRATKPVDPRHTIFRDALERYWRHTNAGTTLPEIPWDGREAKALADLLSASPNLDAGAFLKLLNHRRMSEVNQTERCYVWLRRITDYAAGPLDAYGKPRNGGPNGTSGSNRIQSRTAGNQAAAQAALARLSLVSGNARGTGVRTAGADGRD